MPRQRREVSEEALTGVHIHFGVVFCNRGKEEEMAAGGQRGFCGQAG